MMKSKLSKRAMVVAVNYLARRSMTHYELETRLLEKGYDSSEVTEVLAKLHSYGYLNDREYALMFSESRLRRYSRRRVLQDMKNRGLDPQLIEQTLESTYSSEVEYQQCEALAKRWWVQESKRWEKRHGAEQAKQSLPRDLWIQQKVGRKLMQRGYASELIRKALHCLESTETGFDRDFDPGLG